MAERLGQEVLDLRTRQLGPDDLETAATKQLLAMIYRDQGKRDLAEPLFTEVLAVRTADSSRPPG